MIACGIGCRMLKTERRPDKVQSYSNDLSVAETIITNLEAQDDFYEYVGNGRLLPVMTLDQRETAVIHDLNALTMMSERSSLMSASVSTFQARHMFGKSFIGGDSSSPRFLVANNELILLGTLWKGGGGSCCNVTLFKQQILSKMNQMAPGYSLNIVDLSVFNKLRGYVK